MIVNRVAPPLRPWHRLATLDNFGKMGDQPTHPELLDYLAVEFMKRGWSIEAAASLHDDVRGLSDGVGVRSWRQREGRSENRLLWRYRPQRLDAETIRDAMLSVAGNINPTMGGLAFFPNVPKEIW